nr:transcriptional regulatory protein AlgP-like [Aegilops tauschii subsp. strangulata]
MCHAPSFFRMNATKIASRGRRPDDAALAATLLVARATSRPADTAAAAVPLAGSSSSPDGRPGRRPRSVLPPAPLAGLVAAPVACCRPPRWPAWQPPPPRAVAAPRAGRASRAASWPLAVRAASLPLAARAAPWLRASLAAPLAAPPRAVAALAGSGCHSGKPRAPVRPRPRPHARRRRASPPGAPPARARLRT